MKFTTAIAATVLLSLTSIAHAASIQNSSTGLTGVFTTETFSASLPNYTAAGNHFSGVTFGAGNYINSDYSESFPNIHGNTIANFGSTNSFAESTTLSFATPVSGVAFNFITNEGNTTFTAFLGDTVVESFTAASNIFGTFYGFQNISFNSIRITDVPVNHAYLIDNLEVTTAAVPEPETYALMLAGLGALGFVARRRKSK